MTWKKDWENIPDRPDNDGTAEWDARQVFVRDLQALDNQANGVKILIELRQGTAEELLMMFRAYFAYLRAFYRNIRYLFSDKKIKDISERQRMDLFVNEIRDGIRKFCITNRDIGVQKTKLNIPLELEDKLEELHNVLNEKRYEKRLIVPVTKEERFDTGKDLIKGYDQ